MAQDAGECTQTSYLLTSLLGLPAFAIEREPLSSPTGVRAAPPKLHLQKSKLCTALSINPTPTPKTQHDNPQLGKLEPQTRNKRTMLEAQQSPATGNKALVSSAHGCRHVFQQGDERVLLRLRLLNLCICAGDIQRQANT